MNLASNTQIQLAEPGIDAIEISVAQTTPSRLEAISLSLLTLLIIVPSFLFGGNERIVINLSQFIIFGFLFVALGLILLSKIFTGISSRVSIPNIYFGPFGRAGFIIASLVISVVTFQCIALPSSVLEMLSPLGLEVYSAVGMFKAPISLELSRTADGLFWLLAVFSFSLWLTALPRRAVLIENTISPSVKRHGESLAAMLDTNLRSDQIAESIERAIIYSGLLCSITAIGHWAFRAELFFGMWDGGRTIMDPSRAHWPFINPDHLAVLLEISGVLALSRYLKIHSLIRFKDSIRDHNRGRAEKKTNWTILPIVKLLPILLISLASMMTLSRAGTILLLVGYGIVWFISGSLVDRYLPQRRHRSDRRSLKSGRIFISVFLPANISFNFFSKKGRLLIRFGAFLLGLIITWTVMGGAARELFADRVGYGLLNGFDQYRKALAVISLRIIADYPILGVGLGCWSLAATRYMPPGLSGWRLDFAHNEYLQFFAELGVFGLLITLVTIAYFGLATFRAWRAANSFSQRTDLLATSTAILLPLVHCLVDFPLHIPGLALVFLFLIVRHIRVCESVISTKHFH